MTSDLTTTITGSSSLTADPETAPAATITIEATANPARCPVVTLGCERRRCQYPDHCMPQICGCPD